MPDNAETIELFEVDIDRLINAGHKQGLNYFQLLKVFLSYCVQLQMQAEMEYFAKGGT